MKGRSHIYVRKRRVHAIYEGRMDACAKSSPDDPNWNAIVAKFHRARKLMREYGWL